MFTGVGKFFFINLSIVIPGCLPRFPVIRAAVRGGVLSLSLNGVVLRNADDEKVKEASPKKQKLIII
jgi:hypothetical protein